MPPSRVNPSKKSRGRPSVDSEQVNLRIHRSTLDALDRYCDDDPDRMSRTEAIRRIITDWLKRRGYLSK